MITAAAVVMSISFAALIAAQVSFMRMFGVGLTLAVLVDATLVRMVLVPAFMHVMGGWNWWAPRAAGPAAPADRHQRVRPGRRRRHAPDRTKSGRAMVSDDGHSASVTVQPLKRRRAPRGSGEHLREEILDATTDLLMETGHAKAVSIRSVAQRVGVTPPSIYLHFADKDALLDAVCARYFERLDEVMQQVAADQPSTIDRLRAQGLAYVRFAMQTPELYRIATMGEGRPGSDVDMTLNSSAFVHMRNSIESLMAEGIYPPGDATMAALELWTVAHGVAALLISRPYLPFGDVEEFADRVMRSACCGHIVTAIDRARHATAGGRRTDEGTRRWLTPRATGTVDNPFFARLWSTLSAREPESIRRLRRENLAGLTGRVLEVGAGTGTNFEFYPPTVTEVVADRARARLAVLARQAAGKAPIPVTVSTDTVERYAVSATGSRSTPWSARWCCARSTTPMPFCGNCSRCCGPVASFATSSTWRAPACGRGCSGWPTRPCGRGCSATATPTGTPSGRSSTPGSRWAAPGASG